MSIERSDNWKTMTERDDLQGGFQGMWSILVKHYVNVTAQAGLGLGHLKAKMSLLPNKDGDKQNQLPNDWRVEINHYIT